MTLADGYEHSLAWPDRFQRELMPGWLSAVAAALGVRAPDISRPFGWLDLGCAGGLSTLVAALAFPRSQFVGVDIDPLAIERARTTAHAAGLENVRFIAADLRTLSAQIRSDHFDFIVCHGLYAWVSDEVRMALRSTIQRLLSPGGLACIGYMSHPGAATMPPIQRLLRESVASGSGDLPARLDAGLTLLDALASRQAGFFVEHPGTARQLRAMMQEAPGTLAHEFLGRHYAPQHVADVLCAFRAAGLDYLGSATPIENIDAISIPAAIQPMLHTLPAGPLAETVRDMARNQSLRRDLFSADPQRLAPDAHLAALDALCFAALPGAPSSTDGRGLALSTRIGAVQAPAELFDPLLDALSRGAMQFSRLRMLPAFSGRAGLLNQALQTLLWAGLAHPVAPGGQLSAPAQSLPGRRGWRCLAAFGTAFPDPQAETMP